MSATGFSALQRAENSSIPLEQNADTDFILFQCSSASRKFLNLPVSTLGRRCGWRFSALQRAENSSIRCRGRLRRGAVRVSVLFSEPKIPQSQTLRFQRRHHPTRFSALQRAENSSIRRVGSDALQCAGVSVLFSEPKIPQSDFRAGRDGAVARFQCSSASRKFLNVERRDVVA